MILVNTETVSNKNHETLGLVRGSTVQSRHIGRDIMSSLKTIVGGEIKSYTEMLNTAREVATERMIEEAKTLGADAVVNIRYTSNAVMQGSAEILAYGTAIKFV